MAHHDHETDDGPPTAEEILRWEEIPQTSWTLVDAAGDRGETPAALEELVRRYFPVLRGHLLATLRLREDRVDDLLQGFLADRVVGQNLVGKADRTRGRFRRFLLTALNNYVADTARRERASARRPEGGPVASLALVGDVAARDPAVERHFDRLWASEVLNEVMRRLRALCVKNDRADVWTVLEARVLAPATLGLVPIAHEALAKRLGLASAQQSANLLTTGKQAFSRVFRAVVAEYAHGDDETAIAEEIRTLWQALADG